jgi:hypothetical protein
LRKSIPQYKHIERGKGGGLLDEGNRIRKRSLGSEFTSRVVALHDLDLDTQNTLSQQDVSDGLVDKVVGGLTGVDHESVGELHGLCSGGSQFTRDDDFTTLGAGFHNESKDTVTSSANGTMNQSRIHIASRNLDNSPSDSQTTQQLVSQRLGLSNSAQSSVLDLFSVKLQRVFGELESLGDQGGEFSDSSTLFTEDVLGVSGSDDDLGLGVGHSDFTSRVSLLGEFTSAGVGKRRS